VLAFELAVSEVVNEKSHSSATLEEAISPFWNLKIKPQAALVASLLGKAQKDDIEKAIGALNIRNKIVHEGFNPTPESEKELLGLLRTAFAFISRSNFRHLTANPGNIYKPSEEWAREHTNMATNGKSTALKSYPCCICGRLKKWGCAGDVAMGYLIRIYEHRRASRRRNSAFLVCLR
jgi:hypothetical protein